MIAFILCSALVIGEWAVTTPVIESAVLFFMVWLIAMLLTQKYKRKYKIRYLTYELAPIIKSAFIMIVLLWLLVTLLLLDAPYEKLYLATGCYVLIEGLIVVFIFLLRGREERVETPEYTQFSSPNQQTDLIFNEAAPTNPSIDIDTLVASLTPGFQQSVAELLMRRIATHAETSVEGGLVLDDRKLTDKEATSSVNPIIISRNRLNDAHSLNPYIAACYNMLMPGGWLVGRYTPLEAVNERLKRQYRALYPVIKPFHFSYRRIFPKIPLLNTLYALLSRRRNRVLSRTEVWGRLQYGGFNIVDETSVDGEMVFLARKVKTPSKATNPSFYPIIKLNRVGLDGKIIKAHKIRSMYPYSEFLQQRVFEDNQLAATGKFKTDYRITAYGKFIRKYWLDELPQLIDWLRGDLKLVGIRAMSLHFFSLYPQEYKDLFIKVKPGLVPPLFDENTGSFDEIVQIEYRYLEKYLRHPFRTDCEYLWLTFSHIFFAGVRSS